MNIDEWILNNIYEEISHLPSGSSKIEEAMVACTAFSKYFKNIDVLNTIKDISRLHESMIDATRIFWLVPFSKEMVISNQLCMYRHGDQPFFPLAKDWPTFNIDQLAKYREPDAIAVLCSEFLSINTGFLEETTVIKTNENQYGLNLQMYLPNYIVKEWGIKNSTLRVIPQNRSRT